VEYFVFAGPAVVHDGNLLRLTEIPSRSKFPVKVTVVAWQFSRSTEPRIQTAEMVEQSFRIVK
jgi:ribosomal protein L18E